MAGTRSSMRNQNSSSASNTPEKTSPGQKRKAADASPAAKRGKKQQKTLQETAPDDSEMKAVADKVENEKDAQADEKQDEKVEAQADAGAGDAQQQNGDEKHGEDENAAQAEVGDDAEGKKGEPSAQQTGDEKHGSDETADQAKTGNDTDAKMEQPPAQPNGEGGVEQSAERGDKMPSNILEKGIFYFFSRGRVGIDDPQSVQDFARSYIVLRPLPQDGKITDGALEDLKNNRLLALPKKVMPLSHSDAFLSFVEKAQTSIQELKDEFMGGSEYSTKTTGVRHTPPVTPLVEGVYAITQTNRTSHFAYVVTIPNELGDVQKDMGWHNKGSFVMSVKNPEGSAPANASLPQGADYPEEIMKGFNGLRWSPCEPKLIDYVNAQFLFIGEGRDELGKATEPTARDQKHEKETPEEEMLKLEDEDSHRTGQLNGDDSVFDDLGISAKDYPQVKVEW